MNILKKALGFCGFPVGEVISSVSALQSLKVEPSAEREKQRSEAKHILMQKQRALSDLFKHLTKTGKVLA
jgi:midasin